MWLVKGGRLWSTHTFQQELKGSDFIYLFCSGPNKVVFTASNSSQTNVTELTKGEYEFQLTVTDENGNKASDSVIVTVTQSKYCTILCKLQNFIDIICKVCEKL